MIRRLSVGALVAIGLMSASVNASAGDYVTKVELCGPNQNLIFLQSGTVLVEDFLDNVHMSTGLYDQIYAMALELLSSGRQVGYYNNLKTENFCGVNAIEISVFEATNTP
ncbi:MAG TPA: hypothetical protein VFV77_04010 [Gammaproteobacteria bacterium]|nr:hypothetical protein [Gammaproteobacteria bacterium]